MSQVMSQATARGPSAPSAPALQHSLPTHLQRSCYRALYTTRTMSRRRAYEDGALLVACTGAACVLSTNGQQVARLTIPEGRWNRLDPGEEFSDIGLHLLVDCLIREVDAASGVAFLRPSTLQVPDASSRGHHQVQQQATPAAVSMKAVRGPGAPRVQGPEDEVPKLRAAYKTIFGAKPRGARAGDAEWLRQRMESPRALQRRYREVHGVKPTGPYIQDKDWLLQHIMEKPQEDEEEEEEVKPEQSTASEAVMPAAAGPLQVEMPTKGDDYGGAQQNTELEAAKEDTCSSAPVMSEAKEEEVCNGCPEQPKKRARKKAVTAGQQGSSPRRGEEEERARGQDELEDLKRRYAEAFGSRPKGSKANNLCWLRKRLEEGAATLGSLDANAEVCMASDGTMQLASPNIASHFGERKLIKDDDQAASLKQQEGLSTQAATTDTSPAINTQSGPETSKGGIAAEKASAFSGLGQHFLWARYV